MKAMVRPHCWSFAFLCLLLACQPAWALDPKKAITQYIAEHWSADKGLPQSSIHSIAQTQDGYLWLGTEAGLARFDGVNFTVFDKQNTRELGDNFMFRLVEMPDGSLYIGTRGGGLLQQANGKFKRFSHAAGLPDDHIYAMIPARDGGLWIGTRSGGLSHFRNGKFENFSVKDGLSSAYILSLHEDREGAVWVGTYEGAVHRIKDKQVATYPIVGQIRAFAEDSEGNIFAGGDSCGLLAFKGGQFVQLLSADQVNGNIMAMLHDRHGNLWLGAQFDSYGALCRYRNGKLEVLTTQAGLENDDVISIYEDRENGLWVGTKTGGLTHLKDGKFTTYGAREGLSHDDVLSVTTSRDGGLWVGTRSGLNHFQDGRFSTFTLDDKPNMNMVTTVLEARDGTVWFGTIGGGLHRLRDGIHSLYTASAGLSDKDVWSLYQSRDDAIWVGARDGLYRLKDGVAKYTTAEGLSDVQIRAILEDHNGTLWVGTQSSGLNSIKDGVVTKLTRKEGLPDGSIRCLFEDRDGVLWIGTRDGGLIRMKEGKFAVFNTRSGLPQDSVFSIMEDASAHLWIGSGKGIFRIAKQELNDLAGGQAQMIRPAVFGEMDGIRNSECTGGYMTAACQTRDGRMWFSTRKGFTVIHPDRMKINQRPPPVVLEQVLANREPVAFDTVVNLPPSDGDFEFRYTALAFLYPDRVKFKYRLEGFDKQWIDAGARRVAYYTNLRPGNYRFHVIACNEDGVWNRAGAAFAFYLKPHFYETWWFAAACILAVGLSGVGLHRFRVAQVKAREAELEGLVKDRTRALREEIGERKRAEDRLIQQQALLSNVITHIPCSVFWKDCNSVYLGCNETFARTVGLTSPEQIKGKTDFDLPCSKDEASWFHKCDQEVISRNKPLLNVEEPLHLPDGRQSVMLTSKVPLYDTDGQVHGILGILTDIGDQKKIQEALRGLPQHIIEAQETERRRVARELHDGVIQLLSTAKFRMQSVNGLANGASPSPVTTPAALLDKAIQEIRRISRNLRPSELDDLGLFPAVRSICQEFGERTKIEVELECDSPPRRLPPEIGLAVYRIVQEALTNIEKHSGASRVRLCLRLGERRVELSIQDNGKGFDAEQNIIHYGRETCMGLVDMKERAAFVEGTLAIRSQPGQGTEVVVNIPVKTPESKEKIETWKM